MNLSTSSFSALLMEKTTVRASFVLAGQEFNPDSVTDQLEVTPTRIGRKGDDLYDGKHKRIENFWIVEGEFEASTDIDNQIRPILETLNPISDKIKFVLKDAVDYGQINVVIKVEQGRFPSIHLKKDVIKFMNELGIEIDIDLYCYSV